MFDFDSIREITSTIRKNKLRTALTGFAVAWGIFMLIVLLASGNALKNGIMSNFASRAQNSISIYPGWVSLPYKGLPTNRQIKFDDSDFDLIRHKMPHVEYVSSQISKSASIFYGKEYGSWSLEGVYPDAAVINNIEIKSGNGRFINKIDFDSRRKVAVISDDIKTVLFKEQNPLGKHIIANNIAYLVIGVYDNANQRNNSPPAYIPFSTAQSLYRKGSGFDMIEFTVTGLKTVEANDAFIVTLREKMGAMHDFDPSDRSALYVQNMAKQVEDAEDIFYVINLFVLVVGACSLIVGVIGIGNIMLITVKERTREIGIRKAIGASPASILKLIIFESIFITSISGYIGLLVGIALVELLSFVTGMASQQAGPTMFKDPSVDITTIIAATLVLIVAGVVAGLIPSLKATRISPIEAMRSE